MAEPNLPRRWFLGLWTGGVLTALGGMIVAPAVAFITSPLWKRTSALEAGFSDAGPVDSIAAGQWTLVPVNIVRQDGWSKETQARSVFVLRPASGDGTIKVLSPICTHLGCPVSLSPDGSQFQCPCHGGVYNHDGVHVSGPPPRNMDSLEFVVRDDHLWVRWQDFKVSVPDRIAVQV
jgi:menaquinol-cytochrome c reductase iron-sulfur subunit